MKSVILALLVCALAASVLSCDKFQKHLNMFCKFPGESKPCVTDNAQSFASTCCASRGGCNSKEFPKEKVMPSEGVIHDGASASREWVK
ncbi:hypothetical protein NECAME_18464 [Necator americanus]|uniref:Uncharacterized protein n=1 Tax=Necator americanus TaxID=51031 RepID=W2SU82_NECAM|nr:hypothetical protein NECAME_18464 [Necator americanus]ETN73205.1 hypothetical protein NECAME_18464 [Necator americanus]